MGTLDPNFGVFVENEMDEIRLAYLLNVLGPEKLWKAVQIYHRKWPDSPPFVSTLLKRYQVKVPVALYAPKPPPDPHVYLQVCADLTAFKVGYSGHWRQRVHAFSTDGAMTFYDLDRTVAASFETSVQARRCETMIKVALAAYTVPPPAHIPWGARCPKEWRAFCSYPTALEILCCFESDRRRPLHIYDVADDVSSQCN